MTTRLEALKSQSLQFALFAEVMLDTPIRVVSGFGQYVTDAGQAAERTWLGTGQIGFVSAVKTSEEIQAEGFSLDLHVTAESISQENFSTFAAAVAADRATEVRGKDVRIYIGVFEQNGALVENKITLVASGIGSALQTRLSRDEAIINLECEPKIAGAFPSKSQFLTDADQRAIYPGDEGLEYTSILAAGGRNGTWNAGIPGL